METIEDKIKLKEDYINEKYLNRNDNGYYLKVMYGENGWTAYIFRERTYYDNNRILEHDFLSGFTILESLENIENKYSSELMQRKIDISVELTRMGYKVDHQSVLSTMFDVMSFNLHTVLKEYNGTPVKYVNIKYCILFENDGTLTANANIKYITVYLESMLSSSSPKYKTVDGDLIKGNFSRSIYTKSRQQCEDISFTDEFRIEGIKNFDINNLDKYNKELLKLTENNDCDLYRIKD